MLRNFFQQFEKIEKPKKVITQAKSNDERSGVIKKHGHLENNSKTALIAELEDVLLLLGEVPDLEIAENQKQFDDPIIERLRSIEKKAIASNYKQIQKLCMLAIGKRILNIQLKKKHDKFEKKKRKKSEIQEFFRQNRIKNYDYDSLAEGKLLTNSLIVRPYSSGKGFIQSGNYYTHIPHILNQCSYIDVVKQVNKIFFKIYSGKKKDKKTQLFDFAFKIMWISMGSFLLLILSLPFYTFEHEEIFLTVLMSFMVILLSFVTLTTYLNVPNSNNQIEQSIEDIKEFFVQLNNKNLKEGKQYIWICPQNFMYLEVKFQYDINLKEEENFY